MEITATSDRKGVLDGIALKLVKKGLAACVQVRGR